MQCSKDDSSEINITLLRQVALCSMAGWNYRAFGGTCLPYFILWWRRQQIAPKLVFF